MLPCKWPAYTLAPMFMLIASCTGVPAPAPAPAPLPPVDSGSAAYRIDATRSQLRVLVYRGGPLAALGHNHVIVDTAIAGWIRAGKSLQESSFRLQLAPADFVIDAPSARAQAGAGFADQVTDEARAGTRRNLLGAAQLDADRFPLILIQSVGVQGAGNEATATFRITIAGHTSLATAPFIFQRRPDSLQVSADFRLLQTALGIEPLRVLLGRLQVEDEMHLKLEVVAVTDQASAAD